MVDSRRRVLLQLSTRNSPATALAEYQRARILAHAGALCRPSDGSSEGLADGTEVFAAGSPLKGRTRSCCSMQGAKTNGRWVLQEGQTSSLDPS